MLHNILTTPRSHCPSLPKPTPSTEVGGKILYAREVTKAGQVQGLQGKRQGADRNVARSL